MVKISVIVTVYNAEKYLVRCIDSILKQTFRNFEILLIDDGSDDCSGKICDEYAKIDSRIHVFHKENGGVSSARNVGIKNAGGIYSICVDSDDWVEQDMLEKFYEKAEKERADIVIADYFVELENKIILRKQCPEILNGRGVINQMLRGQLHGSTCNKFVRHRLYSDYNITFLEGINYSEDTLVISRILLHTDKIAHLPAAFYHYVDNPYSITHCQSRKTFEQIFLYVQEMEKMLYDDNDLLQSLEFTKLAVRKNALLSELYTIIEYNRIYKEVDRLIGESDYSWHLKLLLRLASGKFYFLSQWGLYVRKYLKKIL